MNRNLRFIFMIQVALKKTSTSLWGQIQVLDIPVRQNLMANYLFLVAKKAEKAKSR